MPRETGPFGGRGFFRAPYPGYLDAGDPLAPGGLAPGFWGDGYGHGHCHPCVGGVGVYLLRPHWDTNPAYAVFRATPGDPAAFSSRQQKNFDWDTEAAPLVWLGWVTPSGCGVRGRYWEFDADVTTGVLNDSNALASVTIASAAPLGLGVSGTTVGDRIGVESDLRLEVADLEATQAFDICQWSFLVAGGLRYASVTQRYHAGFIPADPTTDSVVTLRSNHSFHGAGPTVAFEARRYLGYGWALYGAGRGSLLFGSGKQDVARLSNDGVTGALDAVATARDDNDDLLPIVELELGGEWAWECCYGRLLFQAGVVSQTWFGAGNAANSDLIDATALAQSADNDSNLGLVGLKLSVGWEY
jgi:hypothetical protein